MRFASSTVTLLRPRRLRCFAGSPISGAALAVLLAAAACAPAVPAPASGPAATPQMGTAVAPSPDPRVGLRPGLTNAGQASWNMRLLSNTMSPPRFAETLNSDLAFTGNYAIQGNFNGWQVWDISNPTRPTLRTSYFCPASQSDVSVYRNLLFVSGEGLTGRIDCGGQGVRDTLIT